MLTKLLCCCCWFVVVALVVTAAGNAFHKSFVHFVQLCNCGRCSMLQSCCKLTIKAANVCRILSNSAFTAWGSSITIWPRPVGHQILIYLHAFALLQLQLQRICGKYNCELICSTKLRFFSHFSALTASQFQFSLVQFSCWPSFHLICLPFFALILSFLLPYFLVFLFFHIVKQFPIYI